jgi:hypothetical protein
LRGTFFPAQENENMNKKLTTNSIMKSRKFDDIELRRLSCLTNEVLYWSKPEDS